jgi:hypothetical protein
MVSAYGNQPLPESGKDQKKRAADSTTTRLINYFLYLMPHRGGAWNKKWPEACRPCFAEAQQAGIQLSSVLHFHTLSIFLLIRYFRP